MSRRMADPAFRNEQYRRRYEAHIAPLNQLVDDLRAASGEWMPYIAPMYGGVGARLLSILRDPGPMSQTENGSGFLSMENDDATAATISQHFSDAGIAAHEIVPWNAYPWYINRAPSRRELSNGIEPLRRLIDLLPRLKVVMLHGGSAQAGWQLFAREYSTLITRKEVTVIATYHPSRQAFWHKDPLVREARRDHLRHAFAEAASHLQSCRSDSA
jgi:hypothetical protein